MKTEKTIPFWRARGVVSTRNLHLSWIAFLVGVLLLAGAGKAHGQSLDVTDPWDGPRLHGDAAGGGGDDQGFDVAVDHDGNIYVAGASWGMHVGLPSNWDMAVWLYNAQGNLLDVFVNDSAAGGEGHDQAQAIALGADGSVYVAGYSDGTFLQGQDMVVWKLRSVSGVLELDVNFGLNGIAVSSLPAGGLGDEVAYGLAIDSAGDLIVAGYSSVTTADMVVWKLDGETGAPTSFGTGGFFVHNNAAGGNQNDYGRAVVLDDLDNIYVAGSSWAADGTYDTVVWKLPPDGQQLDADFGTNGVAHAPDVLGKGRDDAYGITLKGTGSLHVTGRSNAAGTYDMVIWKFKDDGQIDLCFGDFVGVCDTGGAVVHNNAAGGNGSDWGIDLTRDCDSVYVAGQSWSSAGDLDMALWKYDASTGELTGYLATGGDGDDVGSAIRLENNGHLIIAGRSEVVQGNDDMALWKYGHEDLGLCVGDVVAYNVNTNDFDDSSDGWIDEDTNTLYAVNEGAVIYAGQTYNTKWPREHETITIADGQGAPLPAGIDYGSDMDAQHNVRAAVFDAAPNRNTEHAFVYLSQASDETPGIGEKRVFALRYAEDSDGDTVVDCLDNCPTVPNEGQEDTDENGMGDACEPGGPGLPDPMTCLGGEGWALLKYYQGGVLKFKCYKIALGELFTIAYVGQHLEPPYPLNKKLYGDDRYMRPGVFSQTGGTDCFPSIDHGPAWMLGTVRPNMDEDDPSLGRVYAVHGHAVPDHENFRITWKSWWNNACVQEPWYTQEYKAYWPDTPVADDELPLPNEHRTLVIRTQQGLDIDDPGFNFGHYRNQFIFNENVCDVSTDDQCHPGECYPANDERSIMLGVADYQRLYATRDGTSLYPTYPAAVASRSHPWILLGYDDDNDQALNGFRRLKFEVIRVTRGDPEPCRVCEGSTQFCSTDEDCEGVLCVDASNPVDACLPVGTLIQPPFPLNHPGQSCQPTGGATFYSQILGDPNEVYHWEDHKGSWWPRRDGAITVHWAEKVGDVCYNWLGNNQLDDPNWQIYAGWPSAPQSMDNPTGYTVMNVGESRDRSTQCSVEVLHNEPGADLLEEVDGELVVVPDPDGAGPEGPTLTGPATKIFSAANLNVQEGWATLGLQGDASCMDLPVSVEVIRVGCPPWQGRIIVEYPLPRENAEDPIEWTSDKSLACPFDEKIRLRFAGDCGGGESACDNFYFEWVWSDTQDGEGGWHCIVDDIDPNGPTFTIEGPGIATLTDRYYRVRYKGYAACPDNNPCLCEDPSCMEDPFCDNALCIGSAKNPDDYPGRYSEWTEPQLKEGWLKRVVLAFNMAEFRLNAFHTGAGQTYVNAIAQAGERYEDTIAMNCDPANLNSVGLIQILTEVYARGRMLSIDAAEPQGINYSSANQALLLAAGKLAQLYTLLGNEAYADSVDPTIGSAGDVDPAVMFSFENMVPDLLAEELALLRGRNMESEVSEGPVYNRLRWNTEATDLYPAYAVNYNIANLPPMGESPVIKAQTNFPQGHGDAWGHYLTSTRYFYALLRDESFEWIDAAEHIDVGGVPVEVDFSHTRTFAKVAAAKAKTGQDIVALTFRDQYTSDPSQQLQNYQESGDAAWSVYDWGTRAGLAAYLDWAVCSAITPATSNGFSLEPELISLFAFGADEFTRPTTNDASECVGGTNHGGACDLGNAQAQCFGGANHGELCDPYDPDNDCNSNGGVCEPASYFPDCPSGGTCVASANYTKVVQGGSGFYAEIAGTTESTCLGGDHDGQPCNPANGDADCLPGGTCYAGGDPIYGGDGYIRPDGSSEIPELDETPNSGSVFTGLDKIYDQYIGAENNGEIRFRINLPVGKYKFVAAGGFPAPEELARIDFGPKMIDGLVQQDWDTVDAAFFTTGGTKPLVHHNPDDPGLQFTTAAIPNVTDEFDGNTAGLLGAVFGDHLRLPAGATWTFQLAGIPEGSYELTIYAPSHHGLAMQVSSPQGTTVVINADSAPADLSPQIAEAMMVTVQPEGVLAVTAQSATGGGADPPDLRLCGLRLARITHVTALDVKVPDQTGVPQAIPLLPATEHEAGQYWRVGISIGVPRPILPPPAEDPVNGPTFLDAVESPEIVLTSCIDLAAEESGQCGYIEIVQRATGPFGGDLCLLEIWDVTDEQQLTVREDVLELADISANLAGVQQEIDLVDTGLDPLGLVRTVVPFHIDPNLLDPPNSQTHFEQYYDRAKQALVNTKQILEWANEAGHRLREQQDEVDLFEDQIANAEADFKSRLIEVFGYPYPQDPAYVGDYSVPDIYHFDYVDTAALTGMPQPEVEVRQILVVETTVNEDGTLEKQDPRTIPFHIAMDGSGLIKPAGWTQRQAPGEIQLARSELFQAETRVKEALARIEELHAQIEDQAEILQAYYNLEATKIYILNDANNTRESLNNKIRNLRALQLRLQLASRGVGLLAAAVSKGLPTVAGLVVDPTFSMRYAIYYSAAIAQMQFEETANGLDIAILNAQQAKEEMEAQNQIRLFCAEMDLTQLQEAIQLQQLVRQIPLYTIQALTAREAAMQAAGRYRAAVARGLRLLEDRDRIRRQTADRIRGYRYKDVAFRILKNDRLQKYRAQFDFAARYVYLTAKAFDYETNLLGTTTGNPDEFLDRVIKARTLGTMVGGEPQDGGGGLAEAMKQLDLIWGWVDEAIHFDNPFQESRRFSLRWELFRIPTSGTANHQHWRDTLQSCVVADLRDVEDAMGLSNVAAWFVGGSPSPGIVIPFDTTIQPGLNFFGWPLGANDGQYSPTRFTTKIRRVGLWFDNYNTSQLAATPYGYLIPAGEYVMRVPLVGTPAPVRSWEVIDQIYPMPITLTGFGSPNWRPWEGNFANGGSNVGLIRKLSDFEVITNPVFDPADMLSSSELVGRTVWNTKWLLVIPGQVLLGDPAEGIARFIHGTPLPGGGYDENGVTDIKLLFDTYAYANPTKSGKTEGDEEQISGESSAQDGLPPGTEPGMKSR